MPELKDVTVHVTTLDGRELPEWGTQVMRRHNQATTYIQAESDMGFRVTVRPKIPYIADDVPAAHGYRTRRRGTNPAGRFPLNGRFEDEYGDLWDEDPRGHARGQPRFRRSGQGRGHKASKSTRRPLQPRIKREDAFGPADAKSIDSEWEDIEHEDIGREGSKQQGHQTNLHEVAPVVSPMFPIYTPPPDFHFLASLYLDGRDHPERKLVIYLDPDNEDFAPPDGKITFKNRWMEGPDGQLQEHSWIFKDVGIETIFDKMLISGERDAAQPVHVRDEKELIAAMNSTSLSGEGYSADAKTTVGKIELTLERVRIGPKWHDEHYQLRHQPYDVAKVDMKGVDANVTHTAGYGEAKLTDTKAIKMVAFSSYNDEGTFAKFTFFYRSKEVLRKFQFEGFDGAPARRASRLKGRLNNVLINVTPLNIAHPEASRKKKLQTRRKKKAKAFEDRIKDGDFATPQQRTNNGIMFEGSFREPDLGTQGVITDIEDDAEDSLGKQEEAKSIIAKGDPHGSRVPPLKPQKLFLRSPKQPASTKVSLVSPVALEQTQPHLNRVPQLELPAFDTRRIDDLTASSPEPDSEQETVLADSYHSNTSPKHYHLDKVEGTGTSSSLIELIDQTIEGIEADKVLSEGLNRVTLGKRNRDDEEEEEEAADEDAAPTAATASEQTSSTTQPSKRKKTKLIIRMEKGGGLSTSRVQHDDDSDADSMEEGQIVDAPPPTTTTITTSPSGTANTLSLTGADVAQQLPQIVVTGPPSSPRLGQYKVSFSGDHQAS
ncbi:MAG: hypothetical protein M1817_000621 [Caeruleum heppii]|nr:MAG: hypothetical protein M1817_000621 [Caeruleum heppii]